MKREEAISVLNMVEAHGGLVIEAKKMAIEALKQPERIHAKWKVDWDYGIAICSNCNHDYDDTGNGYLLGDEMRYCPFCGAKMIEEGADNAV